MWIRNKTTVLPKSPRNYKKAEKSSLNVPLVKYMREMGIKAQWVKPWTITTKDSDFSHELQNILNEPFNPDFGYLCQEYKIGFQLFVKLAFCE